MSSELGKVRLGEVADIFTGFAFRGAEYLPKGAGIRVVRGDNVTEHSLRWAEKEKCWPIVTKNLEPFLLREGDIVVGMDGSKVGKNFASVSKVDGICLLAQRVARIRAKPAMNQKFMRYVICNTQFTEYVQSIHTGTSIPHISKSQIENFEVFVPSLNYQIDAGDILNSLDDRINLLRETNATLEAIAKAIFKSWFVDFDPVHAKQQGRAPEGMDEATAALFPDSFEELELGLVPTGWKVTTIGENTSYLNRGISPKYTESRGVLVINQKCIRDFTLDVTKARRHDNMQKKIDGRELKIGDVLVNSTGVGTLGRIAQVLSLDETTIVDSHVTVVRASSNLSWNYLGLVLMHKQGEIESFGEGTTGQTELSRSKLASIKIAVPSEQVLKKFDNVSLPLRQRFSDNLKQAQTLATLRDTLLPRLISGQLRLPEAATILKEATV